MSEGIKTILNPYKSVMEKLTLNKGQHKEDIKSLKFPCNLQLGVLK